VLRVYHREHTGRPLRAVWTLEELGVPYELTVMNYEEGMAEEHRTRHPLLRVPVLEIDGDYVFESAAICLHLADLHPEAELIAGLGTQERALTYQWSIFAPAELEPHAVEAAVHATSDPERAAKARAKFFTAADAVQSAIDGSDFLVGNRFGVADVLVGSALAFTSRAKFPEELSPSLTAYLGRLQERPAFARARDATTAAPASS
jgi:glutathione S-transferase